MSAFVNRVLACKQSRQLLPDRRLRRLSFQHLIISRPRFFSAAPRHDFYLDPVFLDIDAGGQEQTTPWNRPDPVILAVVVKPLPFGSISAQRPGLAQHRVDEHLKQRWVFLRLLELLGSVAPGEPDRKSTRLNSSHLGISY